MFLLFTLQTTIAQYGSVWYFGKNAGLDFKFTPPKVLYDGKIDQIEGCAVICDQNGNMLLYTDGQTLWNRKHNVVANGANLGGHPSATQSGIMVPLPGSTTLYYVFSVDYELNPGGLQYAMVDMSANGGDGLVTSKNNKLKTPITEKLTAVKHKNGKDYWILTHEFNNNRFLAYLLTSAGLNTTPVTSDVGTAHKNTQGQGSLKVSQDSKMLAITDLLEFLLEIFEFDNSTGKISNPVTLVHSDYDRVYGIEFSPDGKKLYATRLQSPSRIYQFDLTTMTASAVSASRKLVYEIDLQYGLGSLQLGPDGKIYANQRNGFTYNDYLAVIEKPNETYPACNFKKDAVYLAPGGSWTGLPNVINYSNCLGSDQTGNINYSNSLLQLYNVFTPNNDGLNDAFDIEVNNVNYYRLSVFNRWGELVHESVQDGIGNDGINWNGNMRNGTELYPEGPYFYILEIEQSCSEGEKKRKISGTVTLIRGTK